MVRPFLLLENLTFSAKNLFFFYLLNTSFPNLFFSSFISYHYTINPMILLIIDYFYFILFILKITGTYIWWTHNCALMACFFFFFCLILSLSTSITMPIFISSLPHLHPSFFPCLALSWPFTSTLD